MTINYEYKIGGSLSEDALSYVVRQADSDLYYWLLGGEFCYIFNSRQMGKTSLQVRTMKRLQAEGIACTTIDISGRGTKNIKTEQWYAGIVYTLVTNFGLANASEFLRTWWRERSEISPVQRLDEFIEEVLLPSLRTNIVIFIDEIDSILSLSFPSEDFFAWIRSCYEKRSRNREYKRLTFALLGVATPSDLIADKTRTPFNIGRAIQLNGFLFNEVEPLSRGLEAKVENPQAVMREILAWTGGQPFLTQKLCKLLVENYTPPTAPVPVRGEGLGVWFSEAEWVERIVREQIIENWEAQDEPPHLKTIRDRILMKQHRASRLLGLYQQILHFGEVSVDDSPEQIELRLSGLVVEQQGKLIVYNRIYASVFNLTWVEKELANLRPYAETFTAWLTSNCQDESRLLRGQALQDALAWAENKSLSDEDYQFLSASQELDKREVKKALAVKQEESRILAMANNTLTVAQQKAQRQIRIGGTILALSIVGAIVAGIFAGNATKQAQEAQEGTKLEQAGVAALRQFEFQEIEALVAAMETGQKLKALVKDGRPLEKYPAVSPILALQTILDNIYEQNQLRHQSSVFSADFSPDGQRIVTASFDGTGIWDTSGKLIATLRHQSSVFSADFSPDGQRIFTRSSDDTGKIWDTSGRLLADFKGHQRSVASADFSPDGQRIVTASSDGTGKIWDTSGRLLADFKGHQSDVNSADFSPDGQRIVTASSDGTGKIWDTSGKLIATLRHQRSVASADFSPDGQRIVTASSDGTGKIWDTSGKLIATLRHQRSVTSADFSPDGQRIVTASSDGTGKIWDTSGRLLADFKGHQSYMTSADFSPDGQLIVTASGSDDKVKVWDTFGRLLADLKGHDSHVRKSVSFSPDGQRILTTSVALNQNGVVKVWELLDRRLGKLQLEENIGNAYFVGSPDRQHILTMTYPIRDVVNGVSTPGTVSVWNLSSGRQVAQLKGRYDGFSPDGQHILTISDDNTVRLWDLSGRLVATFKGSLASYQDAKLTRGIFSQDGKRIITTFGVKPTAQVWDLSGRLLTELKGHQGLIMNANFSPDGQHIITVSTDNTARVWNLSGKVIAEIKRFNSDSRIANLRWQAGVYVPQVSFSPDGQRILTISDDNTVSLWDLSGKLLTAKTDQNEITEASFSPNGQRILLHGFNSGTAYVWDLSGKQLAELKGHQDRIFQASFSPDGQRILTASRDKSVRLWELSGRLLAELRMDDDPNTFNQEFLETAFFSQNGQQIVTVYRDGSIRVWHVGGLDELLTRGCDWLKDYLTSHPDAPKVCPYQSKG